jgi:NHLM bacteriocin system ABC transporter ATP-binding protein
MSDQLTQPLASLPFPGADVAFASPAAALAGLPGAGLGEARSLAAGRTMGLDSERIAWAVESGAVEVFAVDAAGGERRFLHSVQAGGILFPAARGEEAGDARLIGLSWSASRLRRIRLPASLDAALPAGAARMLAPAVDAWVNALAPVVPPTAQTWIDVRGTPLSGRVAATAVALGAVGGVARLLAFNRLVLDALTHDFRTAADREQQRLSERDERLTADRTRIFRRLVGLLDQSATARAAAVHEGEDPLRAACRRVSAYLGHALAPQGTSPVAPAVVAVPGRSRMAALGDVARGARLRLRQVVLRGGWWRDDLGPLVGFRRGDGQAVALLPAGRRGYRAVAADGAETRIDGPAAAEALEPMAAVLYVPFPDRALTVWDLVRFGLGRSRADLVLTLLMGALGGALGTAVPLAMSLMFDTVIPGNERGRLLELGLALLAAAAGIAAFRLASDLTTLRVEGRTAGALQAAVLDRILRLPAGFFAGFSSGDLTMRTLVVDTIRRAITGVVMSSLLAATFSVFNLVVLFHTEPRAALVAAALFAILAVATVWTGMAQLRAVMEGETLDANIYSLVQEIVTGIAKLRLAGAEDRAFARWGRIFAEMRTRAQRSRLISNRLEVFRAGFDVLAMACVFWVLSLLSGGEPLGAGGFLAFVAAFSSFMAASYQASGAVLAVFRVVPMAQRIHPILAAVPEVDDSKDDPGPLSGGVEINAVSFRYQPGGPLVLQGVSLSVQPGDYVAVVGASGSGKSTLVRLLLGFERPEAGGVFYDGHDLRNLDLTAVRRQIGVVLQTSRLMAGSLFENVRGVSEAGEDDVWTAMRMAGVEDDIRQLPMGLHTVLTEGMATLSGGQVQRLLIARALVTRPRILLFDEATSALDNRTQAMVTESLDRLAVTRLVIAHRLSTVLNADRILVLRKGKVVEQGTYTALVERNGVFADLVRRQII